MRCKRQPYPDCDANDGKTVAQDRGVDRLKVLVPARQGSSHKISHDDAFPPMPLQRRAQRASEGRPRRTEPRTRFRRGVAVSAMKVAMAAMAAAAVATGSKGEAALPRERDCCIASTRAFVRASPHRRRSNGLELLSPRWTND